MVQGWGVKIFHFLVDKYYVPEYFGWEYSRKG